MIAIDGFIAARRVSWERLELLLTRARGRGPRLDAPEVEELGRLYRQATSDLAIARRDFPQDRVTRYLEQMAGRAHPVIYQREAGQWADLLRFFTHGLPRAFREAGPYTAIAFALFALPFVTAFTLTLIDPIAGRIILPDSPLIDQIERGQSWLDIEASERSLAASFVMTNNIRVALLAFAGGVVFGLGSVFVLINNGLQTGAVAGLAAVYGLGDDLGSFVAAHSGIELTVIFIAGGAGLRLGHALLAPGMVSRLAALSEAARRAIRLIFGCVPLLMIAGSLEGFVSPSALPPAAKLAVGVAATLALYAYLLLAGRTPGVPLPLRGRGTTGG